MRFKCLHDIIFVRRGMCYHTDFYDGSRKSCALSKPANGCRFLAEGIRAVIQDESHRLDAKRIHPAGPGTKRTHMGVA